MKKKKLLLILLPCVALWLAAVFTVTFFVVLPRLQPEYEVNRSDAQTMLEIPEGFELYSGETLGYSFLFPATYPVRFSAQDGVRVESQDGASYILVCKGEEKGMRPRQYFEEFTDYLLENFDEVKSSKIHAVKIPVSSLPIRSERTADSESEQLVSNPYTKTLYMVRYQCQSGGERVVIDRYVELYDNCYLQYTAVSSEAGAADTELYYAIETARLKTGAYFGAFSTACTKHKNEDTSIQLKIPDMLETKELYVGFYSYSPDARFLNLLCTEDENGKPIYNRQDFLDRAAVSPTFVADQLGADSVTFSEGEEKTVNGIDFYCYPMTLEVGNDSYTGRLYLGNARDTGCYLSCYAVRNGYHASEELLELLDTCAQSFQAPH